MTRPRRRRRRRTKSREAAAGTHISSLSDDIVREIFLLLPSLATLVRAALTCRAWRRAVASSPAFRRRFPALHPTPPLLGLFINTHRLYRPPCVPAFVPVVGSGDRDLAAAVRGGDFFLTALLERSGEAADWELLDCRGNYVLVADRRPWTREALMLNPLMRRSEHAFDMYDPVEDEHDSDYGEITYPRLVCSDEDPTSSFHLVLLETEGFKLRASVFSSDTGEWSVLHAVVPVPDWSEDSDDGASDDISVEEKGRMQSQANGLIYWVYRRYRYYKVYGGEPVYLISLDTASMEFSFAKLPQCLNRCAFEAGETKDGAACIVYLDGLSVGVVKHTRDDDDDGGVGRWVPDTVVPLDTELERVSWRSETDAELSLLAVRDGYAYLSTSVTSCNFWSDDDEPRRYCWFCPCAWKR